MSSRNTTSGHASLLIPERARPFHAVIGTPERIYVAWHRDARGVCELLDANGNGRYGMPPQESLWKVRAYDRTDHGEGWANYRPVKDGDYAA